MTDPILVEILPRCAWCADCGGPIGLNGPPDGWQLEDGITVCQSCCCAKLRRFAEIARDVKTDD